MENVMDKIGKQAANTYKYAAKATGKIAKEFKLKSVMTQNKDKIQELYEDIGKLVYEKYLLKENISIEGDLKNNCSMIDILADEIEEIRMELLKLKDLKQCPNCHYEIELDFHYCPNCGETQKQPQETKQNDGPATILTTDGKDSNLVQNLEQEEQNKKNETLSTNRFDKVNIPEDSEELEENDIDIDIELEDLEDEEE